MGTSALALLLLLLLCLVAEERVQSRVVTSSQLLIVESRDYNANDQPVCSPGNCTKCWVYETIKVCLLASITTVDVIRLTLVASGDWIIVRGDVTAASHGPLCVTDVPGADFEKLCLIPYNVDMDNFAFCLNITMTQHNITFLYDNTCFKIPPYPSAPNHSNLEDTVCIPGTCMKCSTYEGVKVCTIATIAVADVMVLVLITNGYVGFQGYVTFDSSSPLCMDGVPGTAGMKLCILLYNVDVDKFAFCLNMTITKDDITSLVDNICFQIPPNPSIPLQGVNKAVGALDFDTEDVDITEEDQYDEDDGDTEVDFVNEVHDGTPFDDVISDDKKMDDETLRFGTH